MTRFNASNKPASPGRISQTENEYNGTFRSSIFGADGCAATWRLNGNGHRVKSVDFALTVYHRTIKTTRPCTAVHTAARQAKLLVGMSENTVCACGTIF